MKCALIRLDTGQSFISDAVLVTNGDGSVSFALPNGGYAGQEPNQYGLRHDQAPNTGAPQSYQRATLVASSPRLPPSVSGSERGTLAPFKKSIAKLARENP